MLKIRDIINVIEDFAPLSIQESWDNSGVQVGSLDSHTKGALVVLDVTLGAIDFAIAKGYKLIISHHPLLFEGIKRITAETCTGAIIVRAIEHGITIYSSHTPSDSTIAGLNDRIASMLSLRNVEVLEPSASNPMVGIGRVGNMDNELNSIEFCELLKLKFDLTCVRHAPAIRPIKRVALCSGSGASLMGCAISKGADAYICGDLKYHDFQRADCTIGLFDIEHFNSEIFFLDIITQLLSKKFPTFVLNTYKDNFISYYGH